MHVYVNGQLSCTVKGAQLCKARQHATAPLDPCYFTLTPATASPYPRHYFPLSSPLLPLTLGTTSPYPRHYFPLPSALLPLTLGTTSPYQDGQHAIKRRLALFWSKDAEFSPDEFIYVRSVAVHSVVLDAEQARARHLPKRTFHHLPPPSTTFHHLPPPSTTFHHLPPPSTTFHHLPPPSTTFHRVVTRSDLRPPPRPLAPPYD